MNAGEVEKHVMDVVRRRLDLAQEKLEVSMRFVDDLGADSLDLMDLTLALELAFDIDIQGDDVQRLRTIQDAIDYIEGQLAAKLPS